jgi:hypothetical protein
MRPISPVALSTWFAVWSPLLGCEETQYKAPLHPCDDWCAATQRAGCEDDWPDTCVSECVIGNFVPGPGCIEQWRDAVDCYAHSPDTSFYCADNDRSTPELLTCYREELALSDCYAPERTACVQTCRQRYDACSTFGYTDCTNLCELTEGRCSGPIATLVACLTEVGDCQPMMKSCEDEIDEVTECLTDFDLPESVSSAGEQGPDE